MTWKLALAKSIFHIKAKERRSKNKVMASALVALIILSGFILLTVNVTGSPGTINVPSQYSKIQDAINAAKPGDTIDVAAGTYREAININKPLSVIGAGADVTFINGSGVTLSAAGLVTITANSGNVTFSGFTVSNAEPVGDEVRIEVLTQSNLAGPTYTISNNKIYGTYNPDEYNDYGFYAQSGKENIVFRHNLIAGTGANNIVLELHTGSTEISYNSLDAGVWGADSIFFMTYGGIDVTTLQNVSGNTFNMGTGGPFDYDHRATGVSFCSVYPALGYGPEAKFTNMVISGNTFNNLQNCRRGIGFWNAGSGNNIVSPIITGNTIKGVAGSTGTYGIDFFGSATGSYINATITGNTINGTYTGIALRSGSAPGTVIHYNNIAGNTIGINWTLGSTPVDAKLNWWGDPTGPYPSGQGDKVTGNVNFEPWLISPYPPATPVQALLWVDPSSLQYSTVSYGKLFTISVKLANVTGLYGYEFKLYWDTGLLDLVKVQITPPWSAYFIAKNESREDLGRYWLATSAYLVPSFTGSTTLAMLTFKITCDPIYPANKACLLDLSDTKLSAPEGVPIYHMVHDGNYSIFSTRPKMMVAPTTYTAHALGETFIVSITISDVVNLYNYTFKLNYDASLLYASALLVGSFLNEPVYVAKLIIDNTNGQIWLSVSSTDGAPPVSGSGILATITFKAIKASLWKTNNPGILSCPLYLHDTQVVTNTTVVVPHDTLNGTYYYAPKPGDLDYDGHVGLTDLRIVAYYFEPAYNAIADINSDGKVDIYDLTIVGTHYGS
jgi:nitrous oxidase accessory protein NosD